jgi:AAA domain/Primase C terminal 1 (PriCT-1)
LVTDYDSIKQHLSIMFAQLQGLDDQYLELRMFHEKDKAQYPAAYWLNNASSDEDVHEAIDFCLGFSERGYGVYIGHNPRSVRDGHKEFVTTLIALYADLDYHKKEGLTWEDVRKAIDALPLEPHLILNSGRGCQIVYFIQPTDDKVKWVELQNYIYLHLKSVGADRQIVTDESRVLRLVGFPNQKEDQPKPTEFISVNLPETLPEIDALPALFFIEEKVGEFVATTSGARKTMPEEMTEGGNEVFEGRNHLLFHEACGVRNRGAGYDEILAYISQVNEIRCSPPLSAAEVHTIAKQASKYEKVQELVQPSDEEIRDLVIPFGRFRNLALTTPFKVMYGLYAGEFGLVQAIHSGGKTSLGYNLSICLATGREFPPFTDESDGEPLRVLYIDAENRDFFVQRDLGIMTGVLTEAEKIMLDENLFTCVDREIFGESLNLSDDRHLQIIEKHVKAHNIQLVFIDTFGASFQVQNENDNSELNRVITRRLKKFSGSTTAAVILFHHVSGKNSNKDAEKSARGRGGSALGDFARLVIDIDAVRTPDGKKVPGHILVNCAKIKGRAFEDFTLKLDPDTRWFMHTDYVAPTEDSIFDQVVGYVTREMPTLGIVELATRDGLPVDEQVVKRVMGRARGLGLVTQRYGNWVPTSTLVSRQTDKLFPIAEGDPFRDMKPQVKSLSEVVTEDSSGDLKKRFPTLDGVWIKDPDLETENRVWNQESEIELESGVII